MATLIQIRRGTASEWSSANPVLANGEIGFISDENKIKIGDGTTSFSSLNYLEAEAYIDSVELGTDTTGNYVETVIAGDGLSVSGDGTESASVTLTNTGVLSLTGTSNEITVSASAGDITLSLPTSITVDVVGSVTGNADTASTLATARNISLGGDVSGSASFDGSTDIIITATVADDSHNHTIANIDGLQTALDNNASSASAVASDLTDHENATTSVHGIADTSLLATKDYADSSASAAAAALVDSAPETLNTLNELAAALGDDANFSTTITNSIAEKLSIESASATYLTQTDAASLYETIGSASAVASDLTDHENSTINVHGIADTSLLATELYVDSSASAAQSSAESYADSLAVNYDPAGSASAVASDLIDHENATTNVHGITDTSELATKTYADNAGVTSLSGTESEINVSASSGAITISLPSIINADTTGNAATATSLETARSISFVGDISGSALFDGTQDITINGYIDTNSAVDSITGTANEINVSASVGAVTVSLPSNIYVDVTGDLTGNADTATTLATARTIALSGDISGSASFDGSASAEITATLENTTVSASSYGSASAVGVFTVDSKGRLTLASDTPIVIAQSAVTNLISDLAAKAPSASPTFTGTANFAQAPTIGTSGSATTITVDGTAITQLRDTFSMYAPFSGQNALQWFYSSAIPQADIDAVQSVSAGTQITVFDGTSTYTFTASGPGDQDSYGSNVLMIPGSGTSSGYYSTGAYGIVPGAPAPILVGATSQTGNSGKYLSTDGTKATWTDPFASPALTGTPTAPTADPGTTTTQIATTNFVQVAMSRTNIITQNSSYILNNGDEGKTIEMNSASANNLTIPLDSSQPIPIGSVIDVIQYGAGQTTIVATSGVTIRSKGGNLKLSGQYSGATLYKRHFNEWVVVGDLTT